MIEFDDIEVDIYIRVHDEKCQFGIKRMQILKYEQIIQQSLQFLQIEIFDFEQLIHE